MQPQSFLRMSIRTKWSCNYVHILNIILSLSAIGYPTVLGCWGNTAPKYGFSSEDYSISIGSNLIVNCTLHSGNITVNKEGNYNVNSSNLVFKKPRDTVDLSDYVHLLNRTTAQLRMPNATMKDSGMYQCFVSISNRSNPHLVCSTNVHVGHEPKPVRNFRCISMHFENLTCTWTLENSGIATNYTLYRLFQAYVGQKPIPQKCPEKSSNSTFCQWRSDTDPPYDKKSKDLYFFVQGANALGTANFNFTLKHYEIVLPDHPKQLSVLESTEESITVRWRPPKNLETEEIPLLYQLWIEDQDVPPEIKFFDVGVNVMNYTIRGLVPYTSYKISVRCRSNLTTRTDMWSSFVTIRKRTLPDVPYKIPETIPEAFEILHYEGFRSVNLYWKPISHKYFNAENFTYHVKCFNIGDNSEDVPCEEPATNPTFPTATINHLRENTSYDFRLYSLNSRGLSRNYTAIVVDKGEKILSPPEDITVISNDFGHYDVSWKPPRDVSDQDVNFVLFWCSSLKPSLRRCEGPIQWLRTPGFNVTLHLPDRDTNFQFAVASSNSNQESSGMRWASCIVPYKAALSKIEKLDLVQHSSTSLKVLWRLNCAALKAVVDKFEIIYCKLNDKLQCSGEKMNVEVRDPEAKSYILTNLDPFSNYSVVIRAYDGERPSENSDPKIEATAAGAPSDPPQDVKAEVQPNNVVVVRWRPPRVLNGRVTHYFLDINNETKLFRIEAGSNTEKNYSREISGLQHYTEYNIVLRACHDEKCSPDSDALTVETDVGVPGNMDPPRIEAINSSFVEVSWNSPLEPNGPIDFYEIQWKIQDRDDSSDEENIQRKNVTTGEKTEVELSCETVEDGGITYLFTVRAANEKDDVILYGSYSSPTKARGCFMTPGLAMIIGIAIGGTLALAFAALLLFKLIKWMRDKIEQLKSITIKLPKGLDGPESNQLNNYNQFKNGLNHPKIPSKGVETLSYAIGDMENKNRHGSGSSQYSNVSTDELLLRNGKCAKFGRKPSGESSGCSSMSSNTINTIRTPLSSDSGAESDCHSPPSPEVIAGDLKCPLPIVMESQDTSLHDTDPGIQTYQLNNANSNNNKGNQHVLPDTLNHNLPNGMIAKMEQPYSKFGITRNVHAIPPWWMNPLAFYSCNLANSEPSVFGLEESPEQTVKPVTITLTPYSKVGLARSSGDILRIPSTEQGLGYSKFGIIRNIERSQSSAYTRRNDSSIFSQDLLSPTVGVAVVNMKTATESRLPKKCVNGVDTLPDRDMLPSGMSKKATRNYLDPRNLSPYISFKQFTQKNGFIQPRDEEAVYSNSRSGRQMQASHSGPPDYVTVNEVQGLTYTPRKSPVLPSSDNVSSVPSENENTYNAESGTFPDEAVNAVGLDEIHSIFQDPKFGMTDSPNEHAIEVSTSPRSVPEDSRSEVHPYLGSNVFEESCTGCSCSENSEPILPEGNNSLDKKDYLSPPGEVLDPALVSPLDNENINGVSGWDQNSGNFGKDSQPKSLEVCLDMDKPNLPLLDPSSLKTEAEKDFDSTASVSKQNSRNPNSLPNSFSRDLPADSLANDAKCVYRTGSSRESDSNSCSPQSHVGYVPFVSLISCGSSTPRNSGEVNASREPDAFESGVLSRDYTDSPRPRTTVSVGQVSNASRPDSPDHFKVPEQNSARHHSKDAKQSLHLHPNSQQDILNDVICDKTGSIHDSPRCTKESISVNGSLNTCFHLVPMVESEICEV